MVLHTLQVSGMAVANINENALSLPYWAKWYVQFFIIKRGQ